MRTDGEFSLHGKTPTATDDRVVVRGSKVEMLRHLESVPDAHREPISLQQSRPDRPK